MIRKKLLSQPLRVIELFAGVGGFRVGLEGRPDKRKSPNYQVIWSNQWEPSTRKQHASLVYEARFGKKGHASQDIAEIPTGAIPDHDLLVGGFPCQDYSVATTLKQSGGIIGQKGVLWWQIHRILVEKGAQRPRYLFLENVDRLLKSPSHQRGRDFAIMLASLNKLGYAVEWRVINAADYGMPQRRRRVFIMAYANPTPAFERLTNTDPYDWMEKDGVLASTFPARPDEKDRGLAPFRLSTNVKQVSDQFNAGGSSSPFENSGVMRGGQIWTRRLEPIYQGSRQTLGDVLQSDDEVSPEFLIGPETLDRWEYLKGAKNETRRSSTGYDYNYAEGPMTFPDALNRPSRTVITGEGGASPSRFKHVVQTSKGLRRLTPVELERLNMFPDGHTYLEGISPNKRAFFMGNALVVGIIEKIGDQLLQEVAQEEVLTTTPQED